MIALTDRGASVDVIINLKDKEVTSSKELHLRSITVSTGCVGSKYKMIINSSSTNSTNSFTNSSLRCSKIGDYDLIEKHV